MCGICQDNPNGCTYCGTVRLAGMVEKGTVESQAWGEMPATRTLEADGTWTYRTVSALGGEWVRLHPKDRIIRTFKLV